MVHSAPKCGQQAPSVFSHPTFLKVMEVLEKVSLVVLAAFAAYSAPHLFVPYFGIGLILGMAMYWGSKKKVCAHGAGQPQSIGCSQGFLEKLTGIPLPPPLGLVVNVAMAYCHIDHHTSIFAPIVGLNMGLYVGKMIGENLPNFCGC